MAGQVGFRRRVQPVIGWTCAALYLSKLAKPPSRLDVEIGFHTVPFRLGNIGSAVLFNPSIDASSFALESNQKIAIVFRTVDSIWHLFESSGGLPNGN